MSYDFENEIVKDGDPAFGIKGTFRIHDTIYVLDEESDSLLVTLLGNNDYILKNSKSGNGYHAKRSHKIRPDDILFGLGPEGKRFPLDFIITLEYADGHKHSLTEPDIHETILRKASHVPTLDWYDRDTDHFNEIIIGRMTGFVKNLVDVEPEKWDEFLDQARYLHSRDFIKSMAAWASRESDGIPRTVRYSSNNPRENVTIQPDDTFTTRPNLPRHYFGPSGPS